MRSDRPQIRSTPRGFRNAGDLHSVVILIPLILAVFSSFSFLRDRVDQDKCGRLAGGRYIREIFGLSKREREREKIFQSEVWWERGRLVRDNFSCLWETNWTEHDIEGTVPYLDPLPFAIAYRSSNTASLSEPASLVSFKCSRSTYVWSLGVNWYRKYRIGHTKVERTRKRVQSGHFPEESPFRTDWYLALLRPKRSRFNPSFGIRDISRPECGRIDDVSGDYPFSSDNGRAWFVLHAGV